MAIWVCPRCGSVYDWSVEVCWRCQRPKNGLRVLRPRIPTTQSTPIASAFAASNDVAKQEVPRPVAPEAEAEPAE